METKIAKENSLYIASLTAKEKNEMLQVIAAAVVAGAKDIIRANSRDMEVAKADKKAAHFLDRLELNEARVRAMADGLKELIDLPDPIGEVIEVLKPKAPLKIKKIRVPLGVVAIIYEARPNVTLDAIGLCLKTGNAIVLRGSKDAIFSNLEIVRIAKDALKNAGFNPEFIQIIEDTSREGANKLMRDRENISVLIPRGSAALINSVLENSTVPVIETGAGNCHLFVHEKACLEMAKNILLNGKLQRPSVCNALESLLIDKKIASKAVPLLTAALKENGVEIIEDESEYGTEFLSLKISLKIVDGLDEAIAHINKYSTKHSETIVTSDKKVAQRFLRDVDSAAVYHNASTRFTDGFEYGFGAEMGISTQKLHARGPMGLRELTSAKFVIEGEGEVRG